MPLLLVGGSNICAYQLFRIIGIELAAVDMLSTLGITTATNVYGPVEENTGGIA